MKKRIINIVGIDEAGRGPLAGPVAVGAALVPVDFDWDLIPGVGDSKKVSAEKREAIFRFATRLRKEGVLNFATALIPASTIDKIGITQAVQKGIQKCLSKIAPHPETTMILLDGLLHAPEEYTHQETITKGDAKEKAIGLASICAKVTRDAHMVRSARDYPEYLFDIHKGYGTKKHIEAIRTHGLSPIHRRSFIKRFQK